MRTRLYAIMICLCFYLASKAQKETGNWYFSGNQGISFNSGNPQQINGIPPGLGLGGDISVCSDASGNMLFIYNNGTVYDRNYNAMAWTGPVLNVVYSGRTLWAKYPGNNLKYFLFYTTFSTNIDQCYLRYTIIDMSLNGGLGGLEIAGVVVDSLLSAGYTLINKKGSDDFWIINNKNRTNNFFARPVTASGVSATKVVSIAGLNTYPSEYNFTSMKASPNGEMFAGSTTTSYPSPFGNWTHFIEVFNFDSQTGVITNKVKTNSGLHESDYIQYLEFSPDNKLLYCENIFIAYGLQPCGFSNSDIYQYNLCYTDSTSFTHYRPLVGNNFYFCAYPVWGNLQTAPNKQVYMRYSGNTISTIKYPNKIGTSCTLLFNELTEPVISTTTYLPNFYQKEIEKPIKNNIIFSGGCYPNPLNFSVSNDTIQQIHWNFGDPSSGAQNTATTLNPSHVFSSPGMYTVTATLYDSNNNIFETINYLIEIKDPSIRLLHNYPTDTTFCSGNSLKIKLNVENGIFEWSSHDPANPVPHFEQISDSFTISYSGTYYVHMIQNSCNGCEMIDSINVTVLPVPYVNLGSDQTICYGDSVKIGVYDFDNNINCIWSTGATTDSIWVSTTGQYWVSAEILSNGCPKRDTMNLTVNPEIIFSLPADTTLCSGQTLLLNATTNNAQYLWQNNTTAATFNVNAPGLYWVTVTVNGCSKTDSIHVNYVTADQVNLGNDLNLCIGNSVTLATGITGDAYLWSTGAITSSIVVNTTGQYWVKLQKNGCWATDTINVQFNSIPYFSLGTDSVLCEHETVLLTTAAPPGITYLWQDNSVAPSYLVNTVGLYWLQISNNGCLYRDSINISYRPLPPLNIGNDTSVCSGNHVLFNAYDPVIISYLWQDGSSNSSFNAGTQGTYWVTVKDAFGCQNTDSVQLNEILVPAFNLGSDTTICSGRSLQLDPQLAGYQHLWSTGSIANQISINNAGIYWVEINISGCSGRDSINVLYKPSPVINLGVDTLLCNNETLLLNAETANSQYEWQDGSNQSHFLVQQPGIYTIIVNENECIAKDTIRISYKYTPVFSLGGDKEICPGNKIVLDPAASGYSYLWQDGAVSQTYVVYQQGLYILEVSNECGSAHDSVLITKGICGLYIPNTFTPNDDGLNDMFIVKLEEPTSYFDLCVYNRYGQLLFETHDQAKGWNGKFKNTDQQTGGYTWILKYTLRSIGKTFNKSGSLILLR